MVRMLTLLLLMMWLEGISQNPVFPSSNAHSHNDYEQPRPFYEAWENGFGSIEADIFLVDGKLLVAHDSTQLARQWTLDSLYLTPLQKCMEKNGGYVYSHRFRSLQLMIDIKSESISTLDKLVEILRHYTSLINASSLKIVISGNRPPTSEFLSYPSWILFDGAFQVKYDAKALERVEMFSDNFARYSSWKGSGEIPELDKQSLKQMVDFAHRAGKKVRFWNAPDTPDAWRALLEVGVDYINTDKIGD